MQYLVDHGHSWSELEKYPLSRIGVFLRECKKQDEAQQKRSIYNTFVASRGDEKTVNEAIIGKEKILEQKLTTPPDDVVEANWKRLKAFAEGQGKR